MLNLVNICEVTGLPVIIWEGCNQGVIKLYSRRGNTKACQKDLITVMNYNCHIILHKDHYNFWISGNSPIFLTEMKIKEIRTTIKVKIASLSTIKIIDVIEEVKNAIEANELKSDIEAYEMMTDDICGLNDKYDHTMFLCFSVP